MTINIQLPKESADLAMKAVEIALDSEPECSQHDDKGEDSFF